MNYCTSCGPLKALTGTNSVYTFQGNSTTKQPSIYEPLDDMYENVCFFLNSESSVSNCKAIKVTSTDPALNTASFTLDTSNAYGILPVGTSIGWDMTVTVECTETTGNKNTVAGRPM